MRQGLNITYRSSTPITRHPKVGGWLVRGREGGGRSLGGLPPAGGRPARPTTLRAPKTNILECRLGLLPYGSLCLLGASLCTLEAHVVFPTHFLLGGDVLDNER